MTSLEYLLATQNRLTFEDIEPNLGVASISFSYHSQQNIGEILAVDVTDGDSYTFSVTCGGIRTSIKRGFIHIYGSQNVSFSKYQDFRLEPETYFF